MLINEYSCGINRYIVGCKYTILTNSLILHTGINRYIVGCKCTQTIKSFAQGRELIDT